MEVSNMAMSTTYILLLTFTQILAQGFPDATNYPRAIKCARPDGSAQRCMPAFENVAFGKEITSNNTCGTPAEQYCVQTGTSGAKKICDTCDATKPGYRHPSHLTTDHVNKKAVTWWQSQSLLLNKYPVRLVMEFKKTYDVSFIRIRFQTMRPHSFAIYKKETYSRTEQWKAFQFYSRDCQEMYQRPNNQLVKARNQAIALCTDKYSDIIPLSGGNVAFATLGGRPGRKRFDETPELQQFVTVSSLRFDLDRLNTFGDEVFGDPKVLRSYYFAISNIVVGGICKCNGHSSSCDVTSSGGQRRCRCEHNTDGVDCEKCLPLYNDRPWRRGSGDQANACTRCDCNGLADSCVFDQKLWADSRQVSGGRCINCKNNTAGDHCERCKEYHHRTNRMEACRPCNCNPIGSRTLRCNDLGQCACKPGVTGRKCDSCYPGYYGFSSTGCRACNCNLEGSLNRNCDATGQCPCRINAVGKRCDQCKASHFDLDRTNPKGCKTCFCFGHGISCTSEAGIGRKDIASTFEVDFSGWRIQDEYGIDRSSLGKIDAPSQYVVVQPSGKQKLYFVAPQRYLGNKLSSYAKLLTFKYGVFKSEFDPSVEPSEQDIIFEGAGMRASYRINAQGNPIPKDRFYIYKYRIMEPAGISTFDFQKILADLTALKIRVTYIPNRIGAIDKISMESTQYVSVNSPEQVTWQEKCACENGYAGSQCELCSAGFTRAVGHTKPYGKCVPCECNNHGNLCHPETGVCECKDNTAGRNCEQCLPGYYGNPTRGNPDDCKPCPCVFGNTCIQIGSKVKCTDCPVGHTGDHCDVCQDGYFGDPNAKLGVKTRCQRCDCSGNVDPNAYGNCDRLTGACLKCVNNTQNGLQNKCEECADGYYGDALKTPKGDCKACKCYEAGTVRPVNHTPGKPYPCDAQGKCECKDNVIGDRCDTCPAGYWNVASGRGCELCDCDPTGSNGTGCSVISGQCACKSGVGGRRCDQCAAGHYQFTANGCLACKCHPDGSKHKNCTSEGRCECRPKVLGVKCDKCPENKYNLTAGCLACPACFNLIEFEVGKLRYLLKNINNTIGGGIVPPGPVDTGRNVSQNFKAQFRNLQYEVNKIRERIEKLMQADTRLYNYFRSVNDTYNQLKKIYDDLDGMLTNKVDGATVKGETEIQTAWDIIEKLKVALQDTEAELKQKSKEIREALGGGGGSTADAKKMAEIAEEARKLADEHEENAKIIGDKATLALNNSRSAYKIAKQARKKIEHVNSKLKDLSTKSDNVNSVAKEAEQIINKTKSFSENAIENAKQLIAEANKPIEDFKPSSTKDGADSAKRDGETLAVGSDKLITDNLDDVKQFELNEKEARDLMEEGRGLHNQSNALWVRAVKANEEAKKAKKEGLATLKTAEEMKDKLENFDAVIKGSKANFTEARKLIPLIQQLIQEADASTTSGSGKVVEALKQANISLVGAKKGEDATIEVQKEIDALIAKLQRVSNKTRDFNKKKVEPLKKNVEDTDNTLSEYIKQAGVDAQSVKEALDNSAEAGKKADEARVKLEKTLDEVEEIVKLLGALQDIDEPTLKDAEDRFNNAQDQIERTIAFEFGKLNRTLSTQENLISQYEDDLEPLRRQIEHTQNLFDMAPRTCGKMVGCIEGKFGCKSTLKKI